MHYLPMLRMPKLLVIEPFHHQEVLFRWAELWRDSDWDIHFWVNPALLADCPTDLKNLRSFYWTPRPEGQSWRAFLLAHQQPLREMDLVLWLTLEQRYDLPLLVPADIPLMTVVHNVASLWDLSLGKSLTWAMRLRSWRAQLKGLPKQRKAFLRRPQTFVFPSEALRQTALPHLTPTQNSVLIPFSFQGPERAALPPEAPLQIVIPGAVRTDKKDYVLVFRTLEQLDLAKLPPIRLLLLGRCAAPRTQAWLQSWRKRLAPRVQLVFYPRLIPEEDNQRLLGESHLALLPLRRFVPFGSHWEELGRTKIAGGVQDAIYHRLPLLLPGFYELPGYSTEDIDFFADEESLAAALLRRLPELPRTTPEQAKWSRAQIALRWLAAMAQASHPSN